MNLGMQQYQLKLENLTVSYARRPAIHHLSAVFNSGEITAVVGPNGAGKSTLLKCIAGLEKIESGLISSPLLSKKMKVAYLPQQSKFRREEWELSVEQFITLGQTQFFLPWKRANSEKLREAISSLRLDGLEKRNISELSGGQFQKVLFARLLQQDYDIYLLDEPLNGLDSRSIEEVLGFLSLLKLKGKIVIAVVHDHKLVEKYFDQFLYIAKEKIGSGPAKDLKNIEIAADDELIDNQSSEELCLNDLN